MFFRFCFPISSDQTSIYVIFFVPFRRLEINSHHVIVKFDCRFTSFMCIDEQDCNIIMQCFFGEVGMDQHFIDVIRLDLKWFCCRLQVVFTSADRQILRKIFFDNVPNCLKTLMSLLTSILLVKLQKFHLLKPHNHELEIRHQ